MPRSTFVKAFDMAGIELGDALLLTARTALERAFGNEGRAAPDHEALDRPGATFVTLMQHGELRGCIGTLEPCRPLRRDVETNTLAAAFEDPRFTPLLAAELPYTGIEVSLLSAAAPITFADEGELLQRLVPGVDGVVLQWRDRRSTFLPQVWEALPEPRDFIAALKRKAGFDERFWANDIRVARYTVSKWKEVTPS